MNKYILWKIKKGKKSQWQNWCIEVTKRRKEAEDTLSEENLIAEKCVIFNDYVFYEHITEDGKKKIPMNIEKEINRKHKNMLEECLEAPELGSEGYGIRR